MKQDVDYVVDEKISSNCKIAKKVLQNIPPFFFVLQ